MAQSLTHISEKMLKMSVDEFGTQSLRTDLQCIPDKFLLKYDPPKICVVYHFKDHNAKDQYWRDLPLEVTPQSKEFLLTSDLFKKHKYYFDEKIVKKEQVVKLMRILIEKFKENNRKKRIEEQKKADEEQPQAESNSAKKSDNWLMRKRFRQYSDEGANPEKEEESKSSPPSGPSAPEPEAPKPAPLPMEDDLELEEIELSDGDSKPPPTPAAPSNPEEKPVVEEPKKEEPKKEEPAPVEDPIEDFVVEDVVEDLTKPKKELVPIVAIPPPASKTETPKKEDEKTDEEQTIEIDGKKFKEIQIEGEGEEEYLMDEEGNIYDRQGTYIGTANADGEGDESVEHENVN